MTENDGWGQPTAVFGGGARHAGHAFTPPAGRPKTRPLPPRNGASDPWAERPAGAGWTDRADAEPRYDDVRRQGSARPQTRDDRAMQRSIAALRERRATERGLPWWAALLILIAVAGIGGYIDTSGGALQIQGGFNVGIVVASLIAILVVRRSHMFPVVIAPPIVYSGAAVVSLYLHGGLSNRGAVIDAASNYLVYGFPAIAAASACVLIVGGIRLIIRK